MADAAAPAADLPVSVNLRRASSTTRRSSRRRRDLAATGLAAAAARAGDHRERADRPRAGAARRCSSDCATLGVELLLDDFGTGYSSLSYLAQAADRRAEDRPLVRRRPDGRETRCRRRRSSGWRARSRFTVVGRGRRDPDQLEALRRLGCALGQGYLFAAAAAGATASCAPPYAAAGLSRVARRA